VSSIVVIGPFEALPSLRERFDSGAQLQTFLETEALEALVYILRHRPTIVALEEGFASSSRGSALMGRLKDDPTLQESEIRIIAGDTTKGKSGVRRTSGRHPVAVASEPIPTLSLDQMGTRRHPRIRMADDVNVTVDGYPAALVDVSIGGAQVLSKTVLKPNQRVRVAFINSGNAIRCNGSIVWATFEMPKGQTTRYRAGMKLSSLDADAIIAYAERHRRR
jgi:hypothetical protein